MTFPAVLISVSLNCVDVSPEIGVYQHWPRERGEEFYHYTRIEVSASLALKTHVISIVSVTRLMSYSVVFEIVVKLEAQFLVRHSSFLLPIPLSLPSIFNIFYYFQGISSTYFSCNF